MTDQEQESEELVCFGSAAEGQLGLGGIEDNVAKPARIKYTQEFCDCREIACGRKHTMFLLVNGSLYACGNNDFCQLGYEGPRKRPRVVEFLSGLSIGQVCCGDDCTLALTNDGHVHSWGRNDCGQLGVPREEANSEKICSIACEVNLIKIVQVACGSKHCLALEANGVVYAWGANNFGQLGLGHTDDRSNPQQLTKLHGIPLMQVTAGSYHSFVNSSSGSVYGWGKNSFGQLGLGDTNDRRFPSFNESLKNVKVVHLACGEDFTAAVSLTGQLFTFGAGTYGQLGHGTKCNELLPKQVVEIMGNKVSHVACGRCHTLVMVDDKVYSFGLNTSGQLGIGCFEQCCPVPQLVLHCNRPSKVFAGGEFSFILTPARQGEQRYLQSRSICTLSIDNFKLGAQGECGIELEWFQMAMSSLNCLNGSFLKLGDERFCVSPTNSGINLDQAMEWFNALSQHCSLCPKFERTLVQSLELSILPSLTASPLGMEALRVYLFLPWCHVLLSQENYRNVVVPFSCCFASLTQADWRTIESWWQDMAGRHLNRVLKVFKNVVSHFIAAQASNRQASSAEASFNSSAIKFSLDVLAHLHLVNKKVRKIPVCSFYVDELQNKVDVRSDYVAWLLRKLDNRFSFCYYPFIFNAVVKATLLQVDMAVQMELQMEASAMSSFRSLFSMNPMRMESPYLILIVSRRNIVDDTLGQLLGHSNDDLKRPLKVQFVGEEADDVGGVKKEFFMLLFQELLHPKYGMFVEFAESRRIWFSTVTFEDPRTYEFVGILCGLAIYNSVIVALPFPLALYKKLLGEPVTLEDFKELSPVEAESLEKLLDYEDDDFADVFSLTFMISVNVYDENRQIELKPNGAQITVDKQNRQEFVDLYVDYKLNKSTEGRFDIFLAGFKRVVTSQLIQFFQPEELMELVVGNEQYDWYEFEKCTEYRGEYWHGHETIKLFWEVFHSFTLEEKKKFLLFLTGSDRIPFLGMKQIKMTIQPTSGGSQYYPVAHTCFNLLDLPKFTEKEKLTAKLKEAIEHNQGFTLV